MTLSSTQLRDDVVFLQEQFAKYVPQPGLERGTADSSPGFQPGEE